MRSGQTETDIENPETRIESALLQGAAALGLTLNRRQIEQFSRYATLLEEWNARLNLTRIPPEQVVPLHFLDSLAVVEAFRPSGVQGFGSLSTLIDIGTGAGFPGLPLKIAFPALAVTLLDSTRKRLNFLDVVIQELELTDVRTLHARAEEAGRAAPHREAYDCAVARAVARLNILVEWLLPFVRVGGRALALKSADVEAEVAEAEPGVKRLGGVVEQVVPVRLPGVDIERRIVVLRKIRRTPPRYPRAGGEIKAHPLTAAEMRRSLPPLRKEK